MEQPADRTYLDIDAIKAGLNVLSSAPTSPEYVYRRPIVGTLNWLFPLIEGYMVMLEAGGEDILPDFVTFKLGRQSGGSPHPYEVLIFACKRTGEAWSSTEDQLRSRLAKTANDSGKVYGLIQIGLEVRFYKSESSCFSAVSEKLHLVGDAQRVMNAFSYIKANPLPFM
ncbi:hypothetical protein B0A49_13562 [Cryomyces minteri]|uniref:Uncharacterized protein n=1 Tax=Cryomyces minteri TaxID=331657 RepID=A0A4U0V7L7_9PEZI|nr:hypothetical protein B0A49_13562 [Cryomyces minteri]